LPGHHRRTVPVAARQHGEQYQNQNRRKRSGGPGRAATVTRSRRAGRVRGRRVGGRSAGRGWPVGTCGGGARVWSLPYG